MVHLNSACGQDDLSVLRVDELLDDHRYLPLKDLNGYFPFDVPGSENAWLGKSRRLKRRVLVANGLWPLPERSPLDVQIYGKVERSGFTVEKIHFQSLPGFYVTGQLFRPVDQEAPYPAVLSPHGHGGRMQDAGERVRSQIAHGEERFAASGRFPKLARCAQLARMGCVVLIIDMIGYADNTQLSMALAHRFAEQRPEMDQLESWGLFSTQAELRCQSIMGLQTWNCVRALDLLCALPEVDSTRIGVTGGSGGGTQTILTCAIDDRPTVAFPQGMVSTSMQGGCTCENCSLLRIGTGNVELAALFAPRPQAMTAADDWTRDMMTLGYPELQRVYKLLGQPENVQCTPYLHFPHNYNYVTRARMYEWFNRHLELGVAEPIVEDDYELLTPEQMTVWDVEHPAPQERGEALERRLTAYLANAADRQIAALAPTDEATMGEYRRVVGGAMATILGRTGKDLGSFHAHEVAASDRGTYRIGKHLLSALEHGEQTPAISLRPSNRGRSGVVVWLTDRGKRGLFDEAGGPSVPVAKLLAAGFTVVSADLIGQGEATSDDVDGLRNRVVNNSRQAPAYTYCYNAPLLAQQSHDVLAVVQWAASDEFGSAPVSLVASGNSALAAVAAGATSEGLIDRLAVDFAGFRFRELNDYRDARFLPGVVKYGDVPALVALNASRQVRVFDPEQVPAWVANAFAASAGTLSWSPSRNAVSDSVAWLID